MDGESTIIDRAWVLLKAAHPELVEELESKFFEPLQDAFDEETYSEWEKAMRVVAISVSNYFDEEFEQESTENITVN